MNKVVKFTIQREPYVGINTRRFTVDGHPHIGVYRDELPMYVSYPKLFASRLFAKKLKESAKDIYEDMVLLKRNGRTAYAVRIV